MSRTEHLVRAMVDLADTLTEDFDVLELVQVLGERAAALAEGTAAGVLLANQREELTLAAASSGAIRALEIFELQAEEGPCFEAFRTRAPVMEADLAACAERWPNFVARATEAGCRGVIAHPISRRDECVGSLNVFRERPGSFDADAPIIVGGLAEMAAVGILTERTVRSADARIAHQRYALESRASVEQAKGILAERLGIRPTLAFERLRRYTRNRNERLRDVADRVIAGELDPNMIREPH